MASTIHPDPLLNTSHDVSVPVPVSSGGIATAEQCVYNGAFFLEENEGEKTVNVWSRAGDVKESSYISEECENLMVVGFHVSKILSIYKSYSNCRPKSEEFKEYPEPYHTELIDEVGGVSWIGERADIEELYQRIKEEFIHYAPDAQEVIKRLSDHDQELCDKLIQMHLVPFGPFAMIHMAYLSDQKKTIVELMVKRMCQKHSIRLPLWRYVAQGFHGKDDCWVSDNFIHQTHLEVAAELYKVCTQKENLLFFLGYLSHHSYPAPDEPLLAKNWLDGTEKIVLGFNIGSENKLFKPYMEMIQEQEILKAHVQKNMEQLTGVDGIVTSPKASSL